MCRKYTAQHASRGSIVFLAVDNAAKDLVRGEQEYVVEWVNQEVRENEMKKNGKGILGHPFIIVSRPGMEFNGWVKACLMTTFHGRGIHDLSIQEDLKDYMPIQPSGPLDHARNPLKVLHENQEHMLIKGSWVKICKIYDIPLAACTTWDKGRALDTPICTVMQDIRVADESLDLLCRGLESRAATKLGQLPAQELRWTMWSEQRLDGIERRARRKLRISSPTGSHESKRDVMSENNWRANSCPARCEGVELEAATPAPTLSWRDRASSLPQCQVTPVCPPHRASQAGASSSSKKVDWSQIGKKRREVRSNL